MTGAPLSAPSLTICPSLPMILFKWPGRRPVHPNLGDRGRSLSPSHLLRTKPSSSSGVSIWRQWTGSTTGSSCPLSPTSDPSTGSCWQFMLQFDTSASCWRAGSSSFSPTTSCLPRLRQTLCSLVGLPTAAPGLCLQHTLLKFSGRRQPGCFWSSCRIFNTFLERTMWPLCPITPAPAFLPGTFRPSAIEADRHFHVEKSLLADGRMLLCSTSTGMDHPLLPPDFCRPAFHALSHPGVFGSCRLLASCFLWPSMNKDIGLLASTYLDCQRTKVARHVRPPVRRINISSSHFSHVQVDNTTRWPAASLFVTLLLTPTSLPSPSGSSVLGSRLVFLAL